MSHTISKSSPRSPMWVFEENFRLLQRLLPELEQGGDRFLLTAGEGEELESREVTQFEEQYQIFLALALALLMAEALVPERKRRAEAWSGRFQ